MADNLIRFRTTVDNQAGKTLTGLDKQMDQLGVRSKGLTGALASLGQATGGLVTPTSLAAAGVFALGGLLVSSVKKAADEEINIRKLTASLEANVPAWDHNTAAIEDVISAREALAFSDDELRDSLARIVATTHDVNKAFDVQSTAMDLARFKGIGLSEASDALIKVEAGQYRALKSLGIVLKEGATQTDALAAVQRVASGQAKAYADTAVGGWEAMEIALNDLQEEIGTELLPAVKEFTSVMRTEVIPAIEDTIGPTMVLLEGIGDTAEFFRMATDPMTVLNDQYVEGAKAALLRTAAMAKMQDSDKLALAAERDLAAVNDGKLMPSFKALATSIDKTTGKLEDFYDVASNKGKAAEAANNIDTAKDAVKGYTKAIADGKITAKEATTLQDKYGLSIDKGKVSTKEASRELDILNGHVADNEQALLDVLVAQDKLGDSKGLKAWVDKQVAQWKKLTKAEKDAVNEALRILNLYQDFQGSGEGGPHKPKAKGGPVFPGNTYRVGEEGEETLVMGSGGGGYVIPGARRSSSGSTGGGSWANINVNFSSFIPYTASQMQQVARALTPELTRELRNQHII